MATAISVTGVGGVGSGSYCDTVGVRRRICGECWSKVRAAFEVPEEVQLFLEIGLIGVTVTGT